MGKHLPFGAGQITAVFLAFVAHAGNCWAAQGGTPAMSELAQAEAPPGRSLTTPVVDDPARERSSAAPDVRGRIPQLAYAYAAKSALASPVRACFPTVALGISWAARSCCSAWTRFTLR